MDMQFISIIILLLLLLDSIKTISINIGIIVNNLNIYFKNKENKK